MGSEKPNFLAKLAEELGPTFTILTCIASLAFWLSTIAHQSDANAKDVDQLKSQSGKHEEAIHNRQRETDMLLQDIRERLARLETKLDSIRERKSRN